MRRIERLGDGVRIEADGCESEEFDQVVIAAHSDQALAMLADPSEAEREILGAIPYQRNEAVLHTDASLLPRRRAAWSSWNFHLTEPASGRTTVTYWMNNLQRLRADREYLLTLNRGEEIDPAKVLRRFTYDHPVYTAEGVAAQARHAEISGVPPHPLLRRLLGLGLPRGRRAQRDPGLRADRRRGPRTSSAAWRL